MIILSVFPQHIRIAKLMETQVTRQGRGNPLKVHTHWAQSDSMGCSYNVFLWIRQNYHQQKHLANHNILHGGIEPQMIKQILGYVLK